MIKQILLYITIIFFNSPLWAQELDNNSKASLLKNDRDALLLHFRFKSSLLEKEYLSNSSSLEYINTLLSDTTYLSKLDFISICATTSPDGVLKYNKQLAYKRSRAIKGYLIWRYPKLKKLTISTRSEVLKWSELISYIEQDSTIQSKSRVLEILQNSDNYTRATIEWRLKNIDNGAVWRHIEKHYFRFLRSGEAVINLYTNVKQEDIPRIDTIVNEVKIAEPHEVKIILAPPKEIISSSLPDVTVDERVVKPLFAIKTNLLYWAALTPNIELEVPIGDRWSVAVEGMYGFWRRNDNSFCWEVQSAGLEGRYWFGDRDKHRVLSGWFAGAFVSAGLYDFQLKPTHGIQGEFFLLAGISGGYVLPVSESLSFEFSAGVGYMINDYQKYTVVENNYLIKDGVKRRYQSLLPAKLKVSLVWTLFGNSKKEGTR